MIKVFYKHFLLVISGHENSNNKLQLICCAISAISNSAINTFKRNEIFFKSKKGYLKLKLLDYSYKNKIKWQMLICELYVIYKQYNNIISWKGKKLWKIY